LVFSVGASQDTVADPDVFPPDEVSPCEPVDDVPDEFVVPPLAIVLTP